MKALKEIEAIVEGFDGHGYILSEELATILFLCQKLDKPVLLEGNPGVGKTTVAKSLSAYLGCKLIRLQCYEGLDVNSSIYEWNYQKQLLNIQLSVNSEKEKSQTAQEIFGKEFLLERPLLQAITCKDQSPVLLIDEIDRADEEFEAFLLEMLSDFQISVPEVGTITAQHKPLVVLTSNRTRELSDALKRRCLYHWLEYPDTEKERKIIKKKLPGIEDSLVKQVVSAVNKLRGKELQKVPGVAEAIDWAETLMTLGHAELNADTIRATIGAVLKSQEDIVEVTDSFLEDLAAS